MNSLYTLMAMAAIRYNSVVHYEDSFETRWVLETWYFEDEYLETHVAFCTSRYVQLIWGFAFVLAIAPLIGFGKYVNAVGMIR